MTKYSRLKVCADDFINCINIKMGRERRALRGGWGEISKIETVNHILVLTEATYIYLVPMVFVKA